MARSGLRRAVDAVGDHPQRVDIEPRVGLVEDRQLRFQYGHLQDLVALLLAAGEAGIDVAFQELLVHLHETEPIAHQLHEADRIQRRFTARGPQRVERGLQEDHVVDARQFHRVLQRQKQATAGTLLRRQRQQVLALEADRAATDLVAFASGEDMRQGAFTRAVRAHDGVHLAGIDPEVESVEDRLVVHACLQFFYVQHCDCSVCLCHQPTAPSRVTLSSFCASTANSIGSSLKTSLQKPLTISETASSSERPRWRQ